jgi:hypothetical protein
MNALEFNKWLLDEKTGSAQYLSEMKEENQLENISAK